MYADRQHKADQCRTLDGSLHTRAARPSSFGIRPGPVAQGRFLNDAREGQEPAEPNGLKAIVQRARNETGLPDRLKAGVENLSGYSLDDVRVHYNSSKPAQLQALAYTQGSDIHVAPGQEKHLPHEAWHVVQQKQGRVQPTMQMKGVNVNDNQGLENEAEKIGEKAIQMKKTGSTIQFNRDIHDTVFYGRADLRGRYLARDSSADGSMPHLTVDTLNAAIGLTNDRLMGAPMAGKRAVVQDALDGPDDGLSADEIAWKEWLRDRRDPLMLNDMNGRQCRYDAGMDNSYLARFRSWWNPPARNRIQGKDGNFWWEEAHDVNVDGKLFNPSILKKDYDTEDDYEKYMAYYHKPIRKYWNEQEIAAHNDYVLNYGEGIKKAIQDGDSLIEGRDGTTESGEKLIDNIEERTNLWLSNVVMNKFWRLTSLMGMDFFIERGKQIDFVREENDDTDLIHGRRPITTSEWMHAENQGYINHGVTQQDPV